MTSLSTRFFGQPRLTKPTFNGVGSLLGVNFQGNTESLNAAPGQSVIQCVSRVRFEWDAQKDRINHAKHDGLDFRTAARVFSDPNARARMERVVNKEIRWQTLGLVGGQLLLVAHTWRNAMAKKSSALSRPVKRVSVKAEDILGRPLNKRQENVLRRLKATPDAEIDYSDIPPLTSEQLDQMVRGKFYRPAKQLVSVRLEPEIVEWLRDFGPGYLTRINDILRSVMQQARARRSGDAGAPQVR